MTTRKTKGRSKAAKKAQKRASAKIRAKGIVLSTTGKERMARAREKRGDLPDVRPTRERLAKPDIHSSDREHRVEDTLARLFRLQRLDADKDRNRELAKAGVIYQQAAHKAGLIGVSAQDLLRIASSRDEGSDGKALAARKVKRAHDLLGARLGSAVHAILVDGHTIEAVGREMTARQRQQDQVTAGMTTLQNGLSILAEKEAAWA